MHGCDESTCELFDQSLIPAHLLPTSRQLNSQFLKCEVDGFEMRDLKRKSRHPGTRLSPLQNYFIEVFREVITILTANLGSR